MLRKKPIYHKGGVLYWNQVHPEAYTCSRVAIYHCCSIIRWITLYEYGGFYIYLFF